MSQPMPDYDGGTCSCGSAWFDLADDNGQKGKFTVDLRGIVTGYSGTPVCADCGERWTPPRERLRVVGS